MIRRGLEMPFRILVVDDNRDTVRTYIKALRRRIKSKERDRSLSAGAIESLLEVEDSDTVSLALEKLRA